MKNTVIVIVLLLLTQLTAQSQNKLENGFTQFKYGNGQVSSEGTMRDGKPDGMWVSYYTTGVIKSKGKRSNFLLDSIWKFYNEQGLLTEEISYLRGKKSGYTIRYQTIIRNDSLVNSLKSKELYLNNNREDQGLYFDKEGRIKQIIRYKSGKKHGLTRGFDKDSTLVVIYKYHNDFLIDREFVNQYDSQNKKHGLWKSLYDKDNIKLEENYKNGIRHGYYREYSTRGELLVSKFYELGVEIERADPDEIKIDLRNEFDGNGQIIASGGFINNTPVGIHRKYTENRSVINTIEYNNSGQLVSDGITDEKGQKDEYWKFYFTTGEVRSEGNFNDNVRHGVWKYFYPKGRLEQTGTFRNGKEDGLWIWYYEDGSLRREESYYRGQEDGASLEFDTQGSAIARGEYIEGLKEGEWYYHVGDHTESGVYKADQRDGVWKHFYLNGDKKFVGSYIQGFANGRHKYYYESGKIKEERFFEMGRKEKSWKKYDKEGIIIMNVTYSNDVIVRINGIRVNLEERD